MRPGVVEIRPATLRDLSELHRLERLSFADAWPSALLAGELASPRASVLVATHPQAPRLRGYALFHWLGEDAELLRLAVEPASRRQGVARVLIEEGLSGLRRRGVRRCHLEVRCSNTPAVLLYRELGFDTTGSRPGYYLDGTDAILFSRRLGSPEP